MELKLDENANWCLSGGADGADLQWAMTAGKAGHGVIHWSFEGHKTAAPISELVVLPTEQLLAADPYVKLANKTLQRTFPARANRKKYGEAAERLANNINSLLRRNWYQVCFSKACYGISTFNLPPFTRIAIGDDFEPKRQVNGGTAWATQMFIDRHNGEACECYVFDQDACYWFQWQGKWVRIYEPPKPQEIWAGVGTRKLNSNGKLAIRVLMDYKGNYHE